MATELDNCCPIYLDSWEDTSYMLPCLHQFCYPCILRWPESKPECPLCKRMILSIVPLFWAEDDFEEHIITPPAALPAARQEKLLAIQLPTAPITLQNTTAACGAIVRGSSAWPPTQHPGIPFPGQPSSPPVPCDLGVSGAGADLLGLAFTRSRSGGPHQLCLASLWAG
ncbi:e3 ubiquitin-protein ligase topor [Limosa lapponica baueri]|uniref:RING-type E3 ubiquitin transferase n=1 Tax=Limosa lapponica baueri TaxID=1758121 RepID=A0A2I0TQ30_LIMLA|nr:e3 ubiquitin-protein ligase topor [Limosa lapponica baueri]